MSIIQKGSGAITFAPLPRTRKRRDRWRGWALALPLAIFALLFFVGPFASVIQAALGTPEVAVTIDNFTRAFSNPVFWRSTGNTLVTAGWAVLTTATIALPFAYGLVMRPRGRQVMLSLLFAPLVINGVVRIYGLQATLNLINSTLIDWGWISSPLPLNYSVLGIVIGFTVFMFPIMAISVYASMSRLDQSLIAAAKTLGANRIRVFTSVVLPTAVPGLVAGGILVFAGAAGSFILPAMMGGGRILTLPQLVYNGISTDVSWGYASALAIILVLVIAPFLFIASTKQQGSRSTR
ncbi:MAG TPA: ABC transporter permease [Microbacteriaceae bacterium]|jgi:ABC-type spermidine/putrescine transport system, permease component I